MEMQTQQNSTNLTLGSLFDGSGGFPLAGLIAGIIPKWKSEIEPFPIRVTEVRFPTVKHYGDVSKIDGSQIEPVDIISFGSPCQDMSIAGKRAGLSGSRSNLFYEATRIIKEMREATNGEYPKYAVWENVSGAFSSNKGEDFRCVLEELCSIKDPQVSIPGCPKWNNAGKILGDGYSIAWRQLDAQYWGVPQRRKRIYAVADFRGWSAGKILFESEGLSGYSPEGFRAWQETAGCIAEGTRETGSDNDSLMFENHSQDTRYNGPLDVAQTVSSTYGTGGNNQPFVLQTPKTLKIRSGCEGGGKGALIQDNLSATLSTINDQTLFQPRVFGICSKGSNAMQSDNPNSGFYEAETTRTLDANGGNPSCNQGGIAVVEGNGSRPSHHGDGFREDGPMYTLNTIETHAVAYAEVHATLSANDGPKGPSSQMLGNPEENFVGEPSYGIGRTVMNQGYNHRFSMPIEEEVEPTMTATGANGVAHPKYSSSKASFFTEANEECANTLVATDYKDPPIVNDGEEPEYIVRRLTPTECARLQGFPDWWCDDLADENPSDEEVAFWTEVFNTHSAIVGKGKTKTEAQVRRFLKEPYSDSAAYKMWGNGIALPNALFVLSGIVYYDQKYDE